MIRGKASLPALMTPQLILPYAASGEKGEDFLSLVYTTKLETRAEPALPCSYPQGWLIHDSHNERDTFLSIAAG